MSQQKISPDLAARIFKLKQAGIPYARIAERSGYNGSTVSMFISGQISANFERIEKVVAELEAEQ